MLRDDLLWQAVWAFAWRIGLALFVLYNIPRMIRGARVIWAEVRVYPPFTWWRALPAGFGWAGMVCAIAFLDPIMKWYDGKQVDRGVFIGISVMSAYAWGCIAILHAYRAAERWLKRRRTRDVSFLDQ